MPAVVSDTSPLVYLTRRGHFGWLRTRYGQVIIPHAVWLETTEAGSAFPEASAVKEAVSEGWMEVRSPSGDLAGQLPLELDPGEAEAIALAVELHALVIIDDAEGREAALSRGLRVTGTGGILLAAKTKGLTKSVKEELARLRREITFGLSEELRALLLRAAGEEGEER